MDELNKMLETARRQYEYDDEASDNNQTSYALAVRCNESRTRYLTMINTLSSGNTLLTQGFQQPNDNVTGLLDITQDEFGSFVLYPNPAVNEIHLINVTNINSITIINVNSQLMKNISNKYSINQQTINVQNLDPGEYIVIVETPTGIQKMPFINH